MYVSSYNTYIDTNTSQKVQKERNEESKKSTDLFSSKLAVTTPKQLSNFSSFPVNYISNYKVLNNQQRLQDNTQSKEEVKFSKIKSLSSAKNAYSENTKLFSLLVKPKATLNQTPKIDTKMPRQAQVSQEAIMRHKMVNTYLENDNYYKITA